jgi:hypothetical protein
LGILDRGCDAIAASRQLHGEVRRVRRQQLAKVVCHNLMCLIEEWYKLGIDPTDWGMPARKADGDCEPVAILRFPG